MDRLQFRPGIGALPDPPLNGISVGYGLQEVNFDSDMGQFGNSINIKNPAKKK